MSDKTTNTSIMEEAARLFGKAKVEKLSRLGHDFIEAGGDGSWLLDTNGNRMLDAYTSGGVFNLGRRHPELVEELRLAMRETDQGNFPMISKEKATLGQMLSEFVDDGLECAIYSVIRGETVEAACKIARGYTGRKKLLSVEGAYHGEMGFGVSLSTRKDKDLFGALIPETEIIAYGDLEAAEKAIDSDTAALIIEPLQVENGVRKAEAVYIEGLRELCTNNGALLIFDETQSGFGRCGTRFAYKNTKAQPDMLIVGEALGGGLFPIAATMLTQKVNSFLNSHPLIHLSTFGGSDIGCRVAKKALEIYLREKPWKNAKNQGEYLSGKLQDIATANSQTIKSVKACGLALSLKLSDKTNVEGFCKKLAAARVLAMPGKVMTNSVLLRPSLLLNRDEADFLVEAIGKAASV